MCANSLKVLYLSLWLSIVQGKNCLNNNFDSTYHSSHLFLSHAAQQCTENFRHKIESAEGSRRGQMSTIETRIIPNMRITCSGTIVALIITGTRRVNGTQDPKLQIWRENKAQCGSYKKVVPEIVLHGSSCSNITHIVPASIFRCTLEQSFHVSVQLGDILGIELPPVDDATFDIYFTGGGPVNYIFQQQLSSTVDTITKVSVTEEQPQITLDITPGIIKLLPVYVR